MSKAGKITAAISGAFLLLIVVAIILIATFDWNRLKPTINQKVSAELNRPFVIRGDLGVEIDKRKIVMDDIKTFGTVQAEVKVYAGITAKIFVQVTEA